MSVDIPPTSPDAVRAKVTAIDANHCPGALMYFFEGLSSLYQLSLFTLRSHL